MSEVSSGPGRSLVQIFPHFQSISCTFLGNLTQYNYIDNVMWLILIFNSKEVIPILISNDYTNLLNILPYTGVKLRYVFYD